MYIFFIIFLFKVLKDFLKSVQNLQKMTNNDRLHAENIAFGRDKYKVLEAIRMGTIKERIDEFESM